MSTKFLHRELKALPRYVRRNGPLATPKVPDAVVLPNPFLPWRNPKTGRWAPSKYSLRQQADLIKQAKATGTAHLLPPGVKLPQPEALAPPPSKKIASAGKEFTVTVEWDRRPVAKAVPGADTGTRLYAARKKMFKGSRLERLRPQKHWRTWVLLHDMRRRIRKYRTHYTHKRPNPLKPTRASAKKLPF
ncbi:hypothetical protein DFH06DRAFT_968037 [Mycena polygramma]|nr:hypothetical protein DFH06DRAFT_968037 [Mycena polygramma]